MRGEESGSCGEGEKSQDSHSPEEERCCSSKISTSRVCGAESRIMSCLIQLSSQLSAAFSWGLMCVLWVDRKRRWTVGCPRAVVV